MASLGPEAEVATSTVSATGPVNAASTSTNGALPLALASEIDALKGSNGPSELTDDILRQVIEERGDRAGRIPPEVLAASPYNMMVSDEEVRRRVKKLLDKESATKGEHTDSDNTAETIEEIDEGKTRTKTKIADGNGASEAEEKDEEAVARDLDMLADTVRSFVADAEGSDAAVGNHLEASFIKELGAEGNNSELADTSDVNVETATEVSSESADADGSGASKDSSEHSMAKTSASLKDSAEVAQEVAQEVAKDTADAGNTVEHSSSTSLNGGGDAVAVDSTALKRPAAKAAKSGHVPKRQKRAEYSEETRALCVRRHQTEGVSYATISKELGIPHDSVRAIVRKAKRTGSVSSAPRSGRPRKTSSIVDKVILEAVRANKQCSAKSIQQDLLRLFGVKVSPETVRRRVLEHTKQRIQSIVGGNSDASSVEVPTAIDAPLSDSLSFQHMLHEESQSTPEAQGLGSSDPTTTDETQAAPSVPSPALVNETADVDSEGMTQSAGTSSQKRPKRGEYSVETRKQCVALHGQGQGYRRIGKALNMPHTTVRAIVEKAQRTGSVLPAKRSGRPRKTDKMVDKVILQAVQANEKSSARVVKEQILEAYGVRVSCETIRRRVKEHSRRCMSTFASGTMPAPLSSSEAEVALAQQQAAHEQEMMALTGHPSLTAASLITFDENGVHL